MNEQICDVPGVPKLDWHQLFLILKDASRIPLTSLHEQTPVLFGASQLEEERAMGSRIAAFIGVPLQSAVSQLERGHPPEGSIGAAILRVRR